MADAQAMCRVPAGVDSKIAAAFLMAYGTSLYALRNRAALQSGERVLVLGAGGGVGAAAVELGKLMGAYVVAAASSDDKLALAKSQGADALVKYPARTLDREAQRHLTDALKAASGGAGFDVTYDPVGGDYTEAALRAVGWQGRYLVVGFAAGEIPRIPLNLALLKSCQIIGVYWGAFGAREPRSRDAISAELMRLIASGRLRPHISRVYPLERAAEGIRELADRRARGKVVVVAHSG